MVTKVVRTDLGGLAATMRAKGRVMGDLRPLTKEIAVYAEKKSKESFSRQADPVTGASWKPRTARSVRRRPGKTLEDTGTLKNRVRYKILAANRFAIVNDMDYAFVHQFGYLAKNIPQRRYAGLSEDDMQNKIPKLVQMRLDKTDRLA